MIQKILKAKHWKLFLLTWGIPIVIQIILFLYVVIAKSSTAFFITLVILYVLPILMIPSIGIFFLWFWSIGVGLHKRLPEDSSLNIKKFKIAFFIPLFYILFIIINGVLSNQSFFSDFLEIILVLTVIVHLLSMFCMFYLIYFCSKTIKSIELDKEALLSDYLSEFLLICFFVIGIWILQPRVNRILNEVTEIN